MIACALLLAEASAIRERPLHIGGTCYQSYEADRPDGQEQRCG